MLPKLFQVFEGPWKWAVKKGIEILHCEHLMIRCAAVECSRHNLPRPGFIARYSGVRFQNRWYHRIACLTSDLTLELEHLLLGYTLDRGKPHRLPIGLLLVNRGVISSENLREALRLQRAAGHGKLGHWLRQIVALEEGKLTAALGNQWGCPVFPLEQHAFTALAADGPPLPILMAARAVPAHTTFEGRQMHIAFSDHVDHTLLYGIEEVLGCRTHACVSQESAVSRVLEELNGRCSGNEICFDTVRDPHEMATTICNYARQLDGRELKVVRAGSFIWAALFTDGIRRDLLFRLPAAAVDARNEGTTLRNKVFPSEVDTTMDGLGHARAAQ